MIDEREQEFLWMNLCDKEDPSKLNQVIKLRPITGPLPSSEEILSFVCKDDETNGLEKFMLFTMDKEMMVARGIPQAEKYDSAIYRVYDVTEGVWQSLWVDERPGENVDFKRIVVYLDRRQIDSNQN